MLGLAERLKKGLELSRVAENGIAIIAAIEGVVDEASSDEARLPSHGMSLAQ